MAQETIKTNHIKNISNIFTNHSFVHAEIAHKTDPNTSGEKFASPISITKNNDR